MLRQMLMVSHDPRLVGAFRHVTGEMQIGVRLFDEGHKAQQALQEQRYDAIVVDCDDTLDGHEVIKAARQTRSNRSSLLLAVINGGISRAQATDLGANFVLQKPLSIDRVRQEIRQAFALLGVDKRQHQRHSLHIPVFVSFGGTLHRVAQAFNLSHGGIGIRTAETIDTDEILRLRFQLPGSPLPIQVTGEIAWADSEGRVGIRFTKISEAAAAEVKRWIAARSLAG